jgi:ribosomal protein S18 acetylase RimI-like enzyme
MILLKKATEADLPTIQEIAKVTWGPTYTHIIGEEQVEYMLGKMYNIGALQEQLAQGHKFLIAEQGSKNVGFASYSRDEGDAFHLHKLYVLPEAHGQGVGKLLMNEVLNKVRMEGGKYLRLNVNRYNKAKDFYESAGFKIKESVDNEIGNGFLMNDYIMEKTIEPA